MTTIWNLFERNARQTPEAVAVRHNGCNATYGQLHDAAVEFADWLDAVGTQPGDRIVLLLPNCIPFVSAYLGTMRAGRVVVALNPALSTEELEFILDDCRPSVIILDDQGARFMETLTRLRERIHVPRFILKTSSDSELQPIENCDIDGDDHQPELEPGSTLPWKLRDLGQIIYTSGTTGRPKGVMLSHKNLRSNCESICRYLSLTRRDSVLAVLPFFYSYGNSLLITHLAVGGRLVLATEFVFWNRVLNLMQEEHVTGFAGVPSTFAMLLFRSDLARREFPGLRYLTCAGGGLLPAHVDALRKALPKSQLFLMYGQTEATARLSTLLPGEIDRKLGSIGRGIPGVTLSVIDDNAKAVQPGETGEIVARGPNIMLGYWNDPEGSRQVIRTDGLHTGDLARVDEDGYIYIVGRKSDMIKTGAYRISPHEIEDVILRHEDIAEVAVVGQPDEIWGEIPVAFVVPVGDIETVDTDAILERCRSTLPRYKHPKRLHLVDTLPRTASGKVRRTQLRESLVTQ